ncbi:hypothetical protein [Methylobacterium sp. CM6247]
MHRISCTHVLYFVFTVFPAVSVSVVFAQSTNAPQYLSPMASISGSIAYNFSAVSPYSWPGDPVGIPFALNQTSPYSFNGINLSLNSSGAGLLLTSPGSLPQSGAIGGILQAASGGAAANSDAPSAGGTSGTVTTNLANMTLNLSFMQAGWAPDALYGLYAQASGQTGGGSTSHDNSGAPGGAALTSNVTINNSTFTLATDANVASGAAIAVEQNGGTGGTGYHDMSAGRGGAVQAMTVNLTDTSVSTSGDNIAAIVARQRGGAAGTAIGYDNSNGADGGSGSSLTVTMAQGASGPGNIITTKGNNASGIFASAIGGNASSGGDDGNGVSIDVTPGNGGSGGNSGASVNQTAVSVASTGILSITTSGANSAGIEATTQGGAGGNGGEARGSGINPSGGGSGGRGDPVTVNLGEGVTIVTNGATSSAILAKAQGGQGGDSGVVDANDTYAQGQNGGSGGITGLVTVLLSNGVTLKTSGESANGITAISSGGNAGDAGDVTAGLGSGHGGNGGQGGSSGGVTVTSGASITTRGDTSRGILVQALSGGGGRGADATGLTDNTSGTAGAGGSVGQISVTHSGAITTFGAYSQGILAQSISGSGGAGGNASGSPFSDSGGRGASGAAGGVIALTSTGMITTSGESAQAIVAQSIGGDGGAGGTAGGMISVDGGASGNGGAGGNIQLTLGGGSAGALSTSGTLSHTVVAQSIGGGGGIGGNAYGSGLDSVSIGGTAGAGGAGGTVTVGANGLVANTTGTGAIGLVAQSIGGSGGAGGAAYATDSNGFLSFSVAVGGSGGDGGAPGTVNVGLSGSTITTGSSQNGQASQDSQFDAPGILAQSIGGSGGVGGGASAQATALSLPIPSEDGISGTPTLAMAYAVGGSGGNGGSAILNGSTASIALGDGTSVSTYGTGSNGAQVQSIGGGGGQGGDSSSMAAGVGYGSLPGNSGSLLQFALNLSVAVGGQCSSSSSCAGGDGGAATLTVGNNALSNSIINTYGDYSIGGMVQSIGGGGGNAGIGSANTNSIGTSANLSIGVTVGSTGGTGGNGGAATGTVNSDGVITTAGVSATGLLVQSIGGGGGVASGGSLSIGGLMSWAGSLSETQVTPTISITPTINLGRTGGSGGNGGTVTVNHAGSIRTQGKNAPGVVAQSVGGGGGVGGTAGVAPSIPSATQPIVGAVEGISVPLGTIYVKPTLSIGGFGGSGGVGGSVTANLSGGITTQGDFSPGLLAQSIGGGGGLGGMAVAGGSANTPLTALAQLSISSSLTLGISGGGGGGANGGTATVNLSGSPTISTSGSHAIGILMQSVGGGGGVGYDGSEAPSGSVELGMTVATPGGGGGDGGTVSLTGNSANLALTTQGDNAHGIVLQSVGGGGGLSATGSTSSTNDWAVNFTIGGQAGALGAGGGVTADLGGGVSTIGTQGVGAAGLIAQSVGGGGGVVAASPGLTAFIKQFGSLNISSGAGSSNGLPVLVTASQAQSSISTSGIGGHGIIAQSIGGGGGLFTGYAETGPAPQLTSIYSGSAAGGVGLGGNVTVSTAATISTTGAGAFGILAQSIGGGGGLIASNGSVFAGHTSTGAGSAAGTVTVNVDGSVSAKGENSIGVFAQSSAPGGAGPITINVNGTIEGGTGAQGVGILVAGGNASNQINIGPSGSVWGLSGSAIKAVGMGVNVDNQGQIYGNTWLQGGSIDGNFQNTFGHPPDETAGTLTNSGTLMAMPGRRSYVDGHLVQTSTGRISPHLDYSNLRSGTFVVTGNAVLDGSIRPNLASAMPNIFLPALTVDGTVSGSLKAPDSPLFSYTLRETLGQYDVAITGTHFDRARFGLTQHQGAVLSALEHVFATGNAGLGPLFAGLDASAGSDRGQFMHSLAQFSPRSMATLFARSVADASSIADNSMSCPIFSSAPGSSQALLVEGACFYATTRGQRAWLRGDADRGRSSMDSAAWQVGGQSEIIPGLLLGGALAYQGNAFGGRDGVSAAGSTVQGAVTLKYQSGPLLLTGAVFGSYGEYDIKRRIAAPGYTSMASAESAFYTAGIRTRAAYTLQADDFYLRPYLNLDLVHARNNAFTEVEPGGIGLTFAGSSYSTAILTPALEIGRRNELSDGLVLRSFLSAGVGLRTTTNWRGFANFTSAPSSDGFALQASIERASGRVTAGVQLYQDGALDVRIQYDGEFAKEITRHGATASLAYRF